MAETDVEFINEIKQGISGKPMNWERGKLLLFCTRLEAANEKIEGLGKENEQLRKERPYADCYKAVCRHLNIEGNILGYTSQLQAKLEQQQAELDKHRWIPVSDPPKTGIYVFIAGAVNGYVSIACYNKEKDYWQRYGAKIRWTITHWKPIILPPKEPK